MFAKHKTLILNNIKYIKYIEYIKYIDIKPHTTTHNAVTLQILC